VNAPVSAAGVVGWDVGGAHLKAAWLQPGRLRAVVQQPCQLWLGLDRLATALEAVLQALGPGAAEARHAVTMTGEVADGFADRRDGVVRIADLLADRLGAARVRLFGVHVQAGQPVWYQAVQAAAQWPRIASMNWWAAAQLVARATLPPGRTEAAILPDAVLADIGSTTTDFIAVSRGRVQARGHDDHGRLASGELVYQGVVRTPLCALGPSVDFGGRRINLMNEFFATSADVYRLTGELDPAHDQHPAADKGSKSSAGTRQRLARMVGLDARDAPDEAWVQLAAAWRARQLDELEHNLRRVVAAAGLPDQAPLVAAGCGTFLAEDLAARLGRRCMAFETLLPPADDPAGRHWARVCAPSAAVALLCMHSGAPA
jgi:probable H4MPT-linked C1 transfer pathway protein